MLKFTNHAALFSRREEEEGGGGGVGLGGREEERKRESERLSEQLPPGLDFFDIIDLIR